MADSPPVLQAPQRRRHGNLHRRDRRSLPQQSRMVVGPWPATDWRTPAHVEGRQRLDGRERDRRHADGRPNLDAPVRAQERLSADHSLRQAVRGQHRTRGIHRFRHRNATEVRRAGCSHWCFGVPAIFLQILHRRFSLPAWAAPGEMSITHAELEDGGFRFTLEVVHPWFGTLVRQSCIFRDANA